MNEDNKHEVNTDGVDIQKILNFLPHRYPFMLIDRVQDFRIRDFLNGYKNVTFNEPFFTGHFPEKPVMPGVLIIEALAQASVVLSNMEAVMNNKPLKLHLFAGIDSARFKRVVEPGDRLDLHVQALKYKRGIWKMKAEASVGGDLACSATLISAEREMEESN